MQCTLRLEPAFPAYGICEGHQCRSNCVSVLVAGCASASLRRCCGRLVHSSTITALQRSERQPGPRCRSGFEGIVCHRRKNWIVQRLGRRAGRKDGNGSANKPRQLRSFQSRSLGCSSGSWSLYLGGSVQASDKPRLHSGEATLSRRFSERPPPGCPRRRFAGTDASRCRSSAPAWRGRAGPAPASAAARDLRLPSS